LTYDRTLLSKALPVGDAKHFVLRPPEFLGEHDIEFKTNSIVTKVDTKNRKITLKDGSSVSYDKLLIATGGTPRFPDIKGIDL
jgi:NAD(P)H-nitrite reductase large subunit